MGRSARCWLLLGLLAPLSRAFAPGRLLAAPASAPPSPHRRLRSRSILYGNEPPLRPRRFLTWDVPPRLASARLGLSCAVLATRTRLISLMALLAMGTPPAAASSGGRISGSISGGQSAFSPAARRERSSSASQQRYSGSAIRSESPRASRRTIAIIERSSGFENRAVLSEGQSYGFLLALLATAASRPVAALVQRIRKRSAFYKIQLLFTFDDKELRAVLDQISAISAAYAEGASGLTSVVEELCLLALRNQDSLVGAHVAHRRFLRGEATFDGKASEMLQHESLGERAKYDRETTGGKTAQTTLPTNKHSVESPFRSYFVLTFLLACKGPLLRIKSHRDGLKSQGVIFPSGKCILSLGLMQGILHALPAYLKSLTTSGGLGYKADIIWTPDHCSNGESIDDFKLNAQWPMIQKL